MQLVLFSDPTLIGTFTADGSGQVQAVFPISDTTLAGNHTLQFTGWCKKIAVTDVLVGSAVIATTGEQGIPPWLLWTGGGVAVLAAALGGWWLVRVMRAPAASSAVTAS